MTTNTVRNASTFAKGRIYDEDLLQTCVNGQPIFGNLVEVPNPDGPPRGDQGTISIWDLITLLNGNDMRKAKPETLSLNPSPPYQRFFQMWSPKRLNAYISAILAGNDIGQIQMRILNREVRKRNGFALELVDGQHRGLILLWLLTDRFAVNDLGNGVKGKFSTWPTQAKAKFREYQIRLYVWPSRTTDDQARLAFMAAQTGVSLSFTQGLLASPSAVSDAINRMVNGTQDLTSPELKRDVTSQHSLFSCGDNKLTPSKNRVLNGIAPTTTKNGAGYEKLLMEEMWYVQRYLTLKAAGKRDKPVLEIMSGNPIYGKGPHAKANMEALVMDTKHIYTQYDDKDENTLRDSNTGQALMTTAGDELMKQTTELFGVIEQIVKNAKKMTKNQTTYNVRAAVAFAIWTDSGKVTDPDQLNAAIERALAKWEDVYAEGLSKKQEKTPFESRIKSIDPTSRYQIVTNICTYMGVKSVLELPGVTAIDAHEFTHTQKEKQLEQQNGVCAIDGKLLAYADSHAAHIKAKALGGRADDDNFWMVRARYNREMGQMSPFDYVMSKDLRESLVYLKASEADRLNAEKRAA